MKVCIILEGCYPYVRGGVSAWVHQYIQNSPEIEFVLWTIHAKRDDVQNKLYDLPANVCLHQRVILEDGYGQLRKRKKGRSGNIKEIVDAFRNIIFSADASNGWDQLMDLLRKGDSSISAIVRSDHFLALAEELSQRKQNIGLSDAFYGLQSIFVPVCQVLSESIPEADVYHSAVTGYGGLLGAMASRVTKKPFVLTEHGIYPREREEELITADWTVLSMRSIWSEMFYSMSRCAYQKACIVTSLFQEARDRQIIIGCDESKCRVIPNGIDAERFYEIPLPEDETIHIGAFVRFAQIKDIKTMIHAFYALHKRASNTDLYIMGGTDDEEYKASCMALIDRLRLNDLIHVSGHIDTAEYMRKMHITLLSSISEGQPLTILESMASARPCVATTVGNCAGLLEEPIENIGEAGICCIPMAPEKIAVNLEMLCRNRDLRIKMGENGRKRIAARYTMSEMLRSYHAVYEEAMRHGRNRL